MAPWFIFNFYMYAAYTKNGAVPQTDNRALVFIAAKGAVTKLYGQKNRGHKKKQQVFDARAKGCNKINHACAYNVSGNGRQRREWA